MESLKAKTRLRIERERQGYATAAEFAAKHDLPESTYRSHENDKRPLTMEAAKLYAPLLGVSWLYLMGEEESQKKGTVTNITKPSHGRSPALQMLAGGHPDKIKVLGMAECGPDGWSLWNGEVIDMVARPPNLAGVPNAYAVFITGDSMKDRYLPGEVAHIHPGKPVTPGCFVLVQVHPKDPGDAPRAILKRLVKRSGDKVILDQLNPPKTFTLKAAEIISMHRVVGSGEP